MRRRTNRWTRAAGSDFRIIIGPAQLLGNAVARSTQPLGCYFEMLTLLRIRILIAVGFILISVGRLQAQAAEPRQTQTNEAVDGLQMTISEIGLVKQGVPNLRVVFRNLVDHDLNLVLGEVGGSSPRLCKLDNRNLPCTLSFKLTVNDRNGPARTYTFRGIAFVAGRIDPYIIYLRPHSTYALELGLDQFWSPATREFEPLALSPETYKLSLEFEGREPGPVNTGQEYISKMTFWKGKITSNLLSITVAQNAQPNKSLDASRGSVLRMKVL